ncbi:pyruvoyl-dependent arginine decarboxylase AaxB, partial [Chlamydia psittaci 06-1683]
TMKSQNLMLKCG